MKRIFKNIICLLCLAIPCQAFAQLSPGELSSAHANLEGIKNCTKCHVLGEKETTSKCLECHTEIEQLIKKDKGYHASSDVKGKKCAECHGEHFGREFQITRFKKENFDHKLTGHELQGSHAQLECNDCHNKTLIQSAISQKKSDTYLGLGTECLSCHTDYHQQTLSNNCSNCHNQDAFRPAPGFNHAKTNFALIGKHQSVACKQCHKITQKNDREFQQFANTEHRNCTSCHEDVHENKFGNDCRKCHDEFSFKQVKSLSNFNHNNTRFPLRGLHRGLECKQCHSGSYTKAVAHKNCTDCHSDFHEGQFLKNGVTTDCVECHNVDGFIPSTYGISQHNKSKFILDGAHLATPCFECHKPDDKWQFANLGTECVNCHENIHKNYISEKYLPGNTCTNCHTTERWSGISFNHSETSFKLQGKHKEASCRDCHFPEKDGVSTQQFSGLTSSCEECHQDVHVKQFAVGNKTDCEQCHTFNSWKAEKFNHNTARFKIDGEHKGLDCVQCHKPTDGLIQNFIRYKFEDISCASCH